MRHFIPLQTERGDWAVAYGNHRGEMVSVMECGSFGAAYAEAAAMTLESVKAAICGVTQPVQVQGNRYLRKYQ